MAGLKLLSKSIAFAGVRLDSAGMELRRNRRFVLLDRDGTINVDRGYVANPDQIELLPNAARGLLKLQESGFRLIVVANQSGIARGYFDLNRLAAVHDRLRHRLSAPGVQIDAIYVCPHSPDDACNCRKPRTDLIDQAVADFHFRPEESIVIGDKSCDILLGQAIGATTVLVRTGHGKETEQSGVVSPDFVADDLLDAAHFIQRMAKKPAIGLEASLH